jgi:hypothetical protein
LGIVKSKKQKPTESGASPLQRVAFTISEFCFRNKISRPTYNRLRAGGRGPAEMRPGLNLIRITAEAERDWQELMQEEGKEFELKATERAVKAGEAAAKSAEHISKQKHRAIRVRKRRTYNSEKRT